MEKGGLQALNPRLRRGREEGRTGSTWIPPAFLANLLHRLRLKVESASTGSHAFRLPLGSASGKSQQRAGVREEREVGIFSPPGRPPWGCCWLAASLTLQWSLLLSRWPSSHRLHWDSRSYSFSSHCHPLCYQGQVTHYSLGFPTSHQCLCKASAY